MNMNIKINGTDITPFIAHGGVKWSRNDVDAPNAGRTMNATMYRGRVATKIRLDITCRPLTTEEHETLMQLLYPQYVTVEYYDPLWGQRESTFYANNHDSTFSHVDPYGREWWTDVSFPLVER